jgi:hypothetical protein
MSLSPSFTRAVKVNGLLLTLLALVITEALSRTAYYLPDPSPLSLVVVVYAAASGGLRQGLISTALVLLYSAYACSVPYVPRQLFHVTEENLRRFLVMAVATPVVALMVGRMKEQVRSRQGR